MSSRLKPKWKKRKRIVVVTAVFLCIIAGIMVFVNRYVNPVIITMATSKVESQAYRALNSAVATVVNGSVVYTDLIKVVKNSNGDIEMLQTNSVRINSLARTAVTESQQNIEHIGENGVEIPIGTLSGIPLLSGKGFPLKIQVIPVGAAKCRFLSEFSTAGINQTRHSIYIIVSISMNVIFPGINKEVLTETQILVTECILVGKVPDTYLETTELDNAFDLVPH